MYTRIIKSSNKYEKRPVFNKSIFYAKTEDIVYGLVGYLINEDYIDKNILYKNLENNENDISTILYNKNSINIQFNNQKQLSKETVSNKEIKCIVVNNYQELIINVKEQYNDQEKCNNQEQFSKEQYNNQEQFSKETVSNKEIKFEEIKFKVVNNNNQESIINFLKSKSI